MQLKHLNRITVDDSMQDFWDGKKHIWNTNNGKNKKHNYIYIFINSEFLHVQRIPLMVTYRCTSLKTWHTAGPLSCSKIKFGGASVSTFCSFVLCLHGTYLQGYYLASGCCVSTAGSTTVGDPGHRLWVLFGDFSAGIWGAGAEGGGITGPLVTTDGYWQGNDHLEGRLPDESATNVWIHSIAKVQTRCPTRMDTWRCELPVTELLRQVEALVPHLQCGGRVGWTFDSRKAIWTGV